MNPEDFTKNVVVDFGIENGVKYPFKVARLVQQTAPELGKNSQIWHEIISQKIKNDGFLSLWSNNLVNLAYFLPQPLFYKMINKILPKEKADTSKDDSKDALR